MKKFEVSVHFDMNCIVVVKAENEEQAEQLAIELAENNDYDLECVGTSACIIDEL